MITDLLVAGFLIAAAPGLPPHGTPKPAEHLPQPAAAAPLALCAARTPAASQMALLEAHARSGGFTPFSLARIAAGSPASASGEDATKENEAAQCKS